jgi:hypothetical protein
MPECGKCGREFAWARTNKGKVMPVDLEPRPDGNLAIYKDVHGQLRARVVTAEHAIETYERPAMPHFATCVPPKSVPIARTKDGAISLADARRRRANTQRQKGK